MLFFKLAKRIYSQQPIYQLQDYTDIGLTKLKERDTKEFKFNELMSL